MRYPPLISHRTTPPRAVNTAHIADAVHSSANSEQLGELSPDNVVHFRNLRKKNGRWTVCPPSAALEGC
jgi:hypothetical protein